MRILLDENLDWRLERFLPGHEVHSVPRIGWAGLKNGILLQQAADAGYEVLVTMDGSLTSQQNLAGLRRAIVGLRAASNRLADTSPLMSQVLALLPTLRLGHVVIVQ
jgi:predicted nuclease of predicted toxin-antitoxin system